MDAEASILVKHLSQVIANHTIVEVYRDRLAEEPLVGNIVQYSTYVFVMSKLDQLYHQDGISIARLSDITRMRLGGRELETGQMLAGSGELRFVLPDVALLEISSAITFVQQEFGHVSLYVERLSSRVCFIGEVTDLDDDFVVLRQFGTLKSMDRSDLLIRLEEVTRVDAGGQYERQLQTLYSVSA